MIPSLKLINRAVHGFKRLPQPFSASKIIARSSSITRWNKDWVPGPYPRTEEERVAAAQKYNMIPEDYEPYPEDEGYGDYPMFKAYHNDNRDPHEPYDYWCLKRNFGEPVHPGFDMFLEDKVNFQYPHRLPLWKQFCYLMGGLSFFWAIFLYQEIYPYNHEMVPKQYPLDGRTYYTFEAAE